MGIEPFLWILGSTLVPSNVPNSVSMIRVPLVSGDWFAFPADLPQV